MSKSINLCFRTLKVFGWWHDGKQSWTYFVLGHLANFFLLWLLLVTQVVYIVKLTSIDEFVDYLSLFLTLIAVVTKAIYFLLKIKKIAKAVDDFEEILKFSEHPSFPNREAIRKKTKQIYNIFLIFWTSALLSCFKQFIDLIRTHTTTFKFGYNYVEGESNTGFWITSSYMAVNSFTTTSVDIVFDLMPVIFMGYAIGLIEELVDVIAAIKTNEDLVKCVQVHVKIKKFVKDIENNFATPILIQGCISSIIFCLCAFLLTTVSHNFIHFFLKKKPSIIFVTGRRVFKIFRRFFVPDPNGY